MPSTPKLLPWVARRNGVPRERAESLWRQALAIADFRFPDARESSDYWAYALRTLDRLAACEGAALIESVALEQRSPARSAVPIIAAQQRIGTLAFDAAEALLTAANEYWRSAVRAAGERQRA